MPFDIRDLQKGRGPVQARSKADEGRAVLKYIDVDDLVPSEDNFYSMSAIDELATLIELSGGVKQPALVSPLGGGKYKVIAGHRRRLASLRLVKQGKDKYRKMPCMVEDSAVGQDAEADELRDIDEAILLITTNAQREKTDWDKVQEATRLRALLDRKRRFEKIPGETRKIIAEQLGTTPAQVGRYDSIEKHLIPRFKELLAEEKINISVAYELSTLPEAQQCAALMDYLTNGELSIEDVKQRKKTMQKGSMAVMADEVGSAPTPEQAKELLERAKDRPDGPVVVPGARTVKAGSAEDIWIQEERETGITRAAEPEEEHGDAEKQEKYWMRQSDAESTGKVVNFPAPVIPTPAPQTPEPLNRRQAANILEDLHMYCEEMLGIEAELADRWMERADALTMAIAALRK